MAWRWVGLALLLAACSGSSENGTGSSGGTSSGSTSGGNGVGSAQLAGGYGFTVGSTWYRFGTKDDGSLNPAEATFFVSEEAVGCYQILSGTRSVATFTLENLDGHPLGLGSYPVGTVGTLGSGNVAVFDNWRLRFPDGGKLDLDLASDAGSTLNVGALAVNDGGTLDATLSIYLKSGSGAPALVTGTISAFHCP